MLRSSSLLLTALAALAADDSWTKVRDLKAGTELRIYKKDSKQPLVAKLDQATEDSLIVILKTSQVAIAKEEIDRIDQRPARKGGRVTTDTKTTEITPGTTQSTSSPTPGGPTRSTSSGLSINSAPEFVMVYRRPPAVRPK
jgi:hypothetical protein